MFVVSVVTAMGPQNGKRCKKASTTWDTGDHILTFHVELERYEMLAPRSIQFVILENCRVTLGDPGGHKMSVILRPGWRQFA